MRLKKKSKIIVSANRARLDSKKMLQQVRCVVDQRRLETLSLTVVLG